MSSTDLSHLPDTDAGAQVSHLPAAEVHEPLSSDEEWAAAQEGESELLDSSSEGEPVEDDGWVQAGVTQAVSEYSEEDEVDRIEGHDGEWAPAGVSHSEPEDAEVSPVEIKRDLAFFQARHSQELDIDLSSIIADRQGEGAFMDELMDSNSSQSVSPRSALSSRSSRSSQLLRALSRTFSFFRKNDLLTWPAVRGSGGRKEGYVELRDLARMDMCGLLCGIDCHSAVFARNFLLLKGHYIFVFQDENAKRPRYAIDVLPVTFVADKDDGQIDLEVEGVLRFEFRLHTKTDHDEWLMALRALQAAALGSVAKKELGHGLLSTQSSLEADKIGSAMNKEFELPFEDVQTLGMREM
mmetsp:Transcript_30881/g.42796  ORF Transcript_30881/g.42796 Transcript_30881/m.42796 type:complete len:353 (-) Transcript_30881:48-1106(-)|eukprot:CAMPEP_0196593902 /NCGR_PEP_ID=MMETSP1081-20130531/76899_1 /TAXON_ID=36882 /ORGANISM="Pyramimonas amylifera, Strain CCMP720" /LENGTH=352 /DNA_ID=CAMNT_0041918025 /DNA_START=153 /DNA_END=1211 /DNA_ORIENTATION=-